MKYQPAETWEKALEFAGETVRSDVEDGKKQRVRTFARSYKIHDAAKRLNLKRGTIEEALILDRLPSFVDPEGAVRIPAEAVETAISNADDHEYIAKLETVHARDLAVVADMEYKSIVRKLKRVGADGKRPDWGEVRGLWGLPKSYVRFQALLQTREIAHTQQIHHRENTRKQNQKRERQRREELKASLIAAFPDWTRGDRDKQQVTLHIGPPNSGKTHDSLEALTSADSGWYLAPLRLLAYEIFERLNAAGTPCNLLTGEEHIPIEGAQFTAATIEMFNANQSGECIIIDEAQMLADPDRGWAWTRAMIEATSPQIHMIAPVTAQSLIEDMAKAANLSLEVQEHNRLTPIRVADEDWSLQALPAHTILVAFSRKRVLALKTELERRGRTVSVVYGSLPPEVRRRQSERFAAGETEICVATDAVGMGLNLPADNVCFYEIEKFDGRNMRKLKPEEVQQIGGRAGRYGLSEGGLVGGTSHKSLRFLRRAFHKNPPDLLYARIAPQLEDLQMIPGTLSEKLIEWSQLRSIPKSLRSIIRIADMEERINLAQMLTDQEVEQVGLAAAVKFINAPTRESTRAYWRQCTKAIIAGRAMPLPPEPPRSVNSTADLDQTEHCVTSADIYLWLAHRPEFGDFAPDMARVKEQREAWSISIDRGLLKRLKQVKTCSSCGKRLPEGYSYGMCEDCFRGRYRR